MTETCLGSIALVKNKNSDEDSEAKCQVGYKLFELIDDMLHGTFFVGLP